ncbi:unnamed protein product [Camellia sinensis]
MAQSKIDLRWRQKTKTRRRRRREQAKNTSASSIDLNRYSGAASWSYRQQPKQVTPGNGHNENLEDDSGTNTEQKSSLTLKAMNGVNALVVVTDCCFHFITDKHNMQKQHAASELLSNIERMADKRFSRSTQAHNITSPTAMVNLNLTSSTRPKIHTSGFEQAMETFLANISVKRKAWHQLQPTQSHPEQIKCFCKSTRTLDMIINNTPCKPEKQKHTVTIDEMVGGRKESILWTSRLIHCTHASCPRVHNGSSFLVPRIFCFNKMGCGARSLAHDLNLEEGNVIGNFNGEFWGMFAGHQFVGNLMSLFLLKDGTGVTTSGSGTTLLYIVFVCSMTLGTILMCFLQKRDAKGEETLPDSSHLAEYTKYIAEPALGESGVGGAMAVYWAFDAIVNSVYIWNMCQCSLAMGRLTSGLKSITLIVCAGAFIQLIVLLWLLLKYSVTSGVLGILYPLIMAAALGIGDGIFNTQLNALLGMLFKHDMIRRSICTTQGLAVCFDRSCVFFCISVGGFLFLILMVEKAFSCAD